MSEWVENFGFLPWTCSPECIQLQMIFLQNMKQKKTHSQKVLFGAVVLCIHLAALWWSPKEGETAGKHHSSAHTELSLLFSQPGMDHSAVSDAGSQQVCL